MHRFTSRSSNATLPCNPLQELRKHGVTLHLLLESERQAIPDVPAVYYVSASEAAVQRIVRDVQRGLYDSFHINFATHISRPLLEALAAGGSDGCGGLETLCLPGNS